MNKKPKSIFPTMSDDVDALTKEIRRLNYRPHTQGEMGEKKNSFSNYKDYIGLDLSSCSDRQQSSLRPRAPPPRLNSNRSVSSLSNNSTSDISSQSLSQSQSQLQKKKNKKGNITELWKSLSHSNSIMGRSFNGSIGGEGMRKNANNNNGNGNDDDVDDDNDNDDREIGMGVDGIQFLNIIDKSMKANDAGSMGIKSKSFTASLSSSSSSSSSSSTSRARNNGQSNSNNNNDGRSRSGNGNNNNMLFQRQDSIVSRGGRRIKNQPSTEFSIPNLPTGKLLRFNILSTWGDIHYLGLMGIEIFDDTGNIIRVSNLEQQIWANPADINVLAEYENDPRTVDNLLDGVNHTTDDLHAWLAPFTTGQDHLIYIDLDHTSTTISMIRIWNYNKSRIHSFRGARYIEIEFDGCPIFKGEIKRASGSHSPLKSDDACECILFTSSKTILDLIEKNDPISIAHQLALLELKEEKETKLNSNRQHEYQYEQAMHLYEENEIEDRSDFSIDSKWHNNNNNDIDNYNDNDNILMQRPTTGTGGKRNITPSSSSTSSTNITSTTTFNKEISQRSMIARPSTASIAKNQLPVQAKVVDFCIISNWGDAEVVGLTGISGLDENLIDFTLPLPTLYTGFINIVEDESIQSIQQLQRVSSSSYSLKNLINGSNITTNSSQMWSISANHLGKVSATSLSSNRVLVLRFYFGDDNNNDNSNNNNNINNKNKNNNNQSSSSSSKKLLKGLRVWNYNAGHEETCSGVKHVHVFLDGVLHSKSVIRKAPGEMTFNYNQFLPLLNTKKQKMRKENSGSGSSSGRTGGTSNESESSSFYENFASRISNHHHLSIEKKKKISFKRRNEKGTEGENDLHFKYMTDGIIDDDDDDSDDDNNKFRFTNFSPTNNNSSNSNSNSNKMKMPIPCGTCNVVQQYETPLEPTGCLFKVVIHSTHGDGYYVGLNGLVLYDRYGIPISISSEQIQASPYRDINDLVDIQKLNPNGHDSRCLENLIDNNTLNDTFEDKNMWLVPFSGPNSNARTGPPNQIFILFDEPVTISYMKFWNYAKTNTRGVKELEIFVDDVLVFRGSLHKSPTQAEILSSSSSSSSSQVRFVGSEVPNWGSNITTDLDLSQSIIFTNNSDIIEREEQRVPIVEEMIEFIDDGKSVEMFDLYNSSYYHHEGDASALRRPMTASTK